MHCPGESSYCNNTFAPKTAYFLGNFLWNIALGKGHYLQRQHICPRTSVPLRQHKHFPSKWLVIFEEFFFDNFLCFLNFIFPNGKNLPKKTRRWTNVTNVRGQRHVLFFFPVLWRVNPQVKGITKIRAGEAIAERRQSGRIFL